MTEVRKTIIDSVFNKRNATGNLEETYVAHLKIWEDAENEAGGRKPRYILLSRASNGAGFIHKSKRNTNGTFSVGKTWKLSELRAIQVVNPLAFNVTMSRTYKWQAENRDEQAIFLDAFVRLFRNLSGPRAPLYLDGLQDHDVSAEVTAQSVPTGNAGRKPSPSRRAPLPQSARVNLSETQTRMSFPKPHSLNDAVPYQPADHRPPSIGVPPVSATFQHRESSNSTEASARIPASASQVIRARPRISEFEANSLQTPLTRLGRAEDTNAPISETTQSRRDQKARISFFDPVNQAILERLILGNEIRVEVDAEDENAQVTLASVEEMIEGYEWASDDVIGRKMTKGTVDMIEARLLDELTALEKANIHSFLESDDRVGVVTKFIDDALAELDNIEGLISSYKIHLGAVNEDISFIQSQNRGLQVQTQNQRALLAELQNLLRTVHVDQEALTTLTQESLEKAQSIHRLEEAAVQLYKALQAGRDTDMAATMERLQEYQMFNAQFCKRMFDFLSIMFAAQSKLLLSDTSGLIKGSSGPKVIPHTDLEAYLGRYTGLMLYLREMDETVYTKLSGAYFSAASDLHNEQIKALLSAHLDLVKKLTEEEIDQGSMALSRAGTMRRAGTIMKSPRDGRQRDHDKPSEGDQRASEVFALWLEQVVTLICREDEFATDFLQINDAGLTFADYMGLDNYFRRQAARTSSLQQTTLKLIRGALDLIFGFLPAEMKAWLDAALAKDRMGLVGIIAHLERFQIEADEKGNPFVIGLLEKQHSRLRSLLDRHITDQLKGIEQTKLSGKKRRGIAQFIRNFPGYATGIESQLIGADNLEIRASVDSAYEKITQVMFESLKQMAKLESDGEDKGQLNRHVILIENMNYFITEIADMDVASLLAASRRAEAIYEENLASYIRLVFRRSFGKIMDFFEGVDRIVQGNPNDLTSNPSYNKVALKKLLKDYNLKDIKKYIDALAKRVEKHFTETAEKDESAGNISGKILNAVWKACEDEFVKLTETWTSRISQFYGDGSISLEYTVSDGEGAFRRQKFGT